MIPRLLTFAGAFGLLCCTAMAQQPIRGGTLNMVVQPEPPTVMMGIGRVTPVYLVGSKVFEGLIALAPDMTPLPRLAKSWTISDDGLTYTFHLQQNVKWHDGHPFTSRDVVYSFSKFLPEAVSRIKIVSQKIASLTASDDYTVIFKLKEPYAAFMMAFEVSDGPIVPAHLYEGTNIYENPANQKPVGTGPFVFRKWQKGQYIHVTRNKNYWQDGKPLLEEIYFHVIPDANSRAIAFEQGNIDVLSGGDVEQFEVKRLAETPGVKMTDKGWEYFDPIAFVNLNLRKPPLDNVKVRQAISFAYDRQFVIDAIFGGFGKPAFGPMTHRTPFFDPEALTDYSFDMKKAKQLMAESGLRPDAKGVYATVELTPLPYGEAWQRQGEYLRQQLREIGIATKVVSVDVAGWAERATSGRFDITANYVFLRGDPAVGVEQTYLSTNQLSRGGGANLGGYVNPKIDELFLKSSRTIDKNLRQAGYSEVQKILSQEIPVLWSHEMSLPTLYRGKINNLITTATGLNDNFADVWMSK